MKTSTALERAIYVRMKYSSPRTGFLFHLYGRICCVNHLGTNKLYNQHFKARWSHRFSSSKFTNQWWWLLHLPLELLQSTKHVTNPKFNQLCLEFHGRAIVPILLTEMCDTGRGRVASFCI